MKLPELLHSLNEAHYFSSSECFCFTSKTYPLLFFSQFFKSLKATSKVSIQKIVLDDFEVSHIKGMLSTSFLGSMHIFWLHSISDLKKNKKTELIRFLTSYKGPNIVMFFVDESDFPNKKHTMAWRSIVLPEVVDFQLSIALIDSLFQSKSALKTFAKQLFSVHKEIPMDSFFLLMEYGLLTGKKTSAFFKTWLHELVVPDISLFTLSQYFFAKNAHDFFILWRQLAHKFSVQFWIAFWSERLWRASMYVELIHQKRRQEAQKISYKLPFSFMQKDWRNYQSHELVAAHGAVYDLDYIIKNGAHPVGLELFYTSFFLGQFKNI